ncbi:ParB N-terminal domain-containing protein [Rhizobium sp. BK661]|uniref:ParB N-terminal domain-containing protein n=1 Tax=Rhizobium sp. BK661 TaxID=2586991 RepID=UPI002168E99B|nr:ParB N-terminal domain-containing protein [Rhizobium sp. BK661]MCS3738240.1 putative DNA-binding protein (UPF0251 family) [Rhizobium sp. BK661]
MPDTNHRITTTASQEVAESILSKVHNQPFARALETLRAASELTTEVVDPPPTHVPQKDLIKIPQVFQIRDQDVHESHVSDLKRLLTLHKALDPITVWRCEQSVIVIDGHHRLEAYRLWNREAPIPVSFFKGTVEQAIQFAETANSKAKLQVTYREKANYAWRLVVHADELGKLSKAQLIQRTHISKGTIDKMRKVARELGPQARTFSQWDKADREWQRQTTGVEHEIDDAWIQMEAMRVVDRLGATFAKTLANRPEVTATAFSHILGRKSLEIAQLMVEAKGLTMVLYDRDGNEINDLDGYEPPETEPDNIELPF